MTSRPPNRSTAKRDRRLEVGERVDVGVPEVRDAARGADARGDARRRSSSFDVGDDDGGALRREAPDRRGADARRAAGDDRHLARRACPSRRFARESRGLAARFRVADARCRPRLRPLLRDPGRRALARAQRARRLPRRDRAGGARRGGRASRTSGPSSTTSSREFSHCSAPEVLYGAVAAKTTTLRIGHGVRLLPFPYNHPIRVAEMAAALDLVSRRPPRVRHRPLVDARRARGLRHRPARHARRCGRRRSTWSSAPGPRTCSRGRASYFKVPPRRVHPKPLQQPHPPIWVASTNPTSHELAGPEGARAPLLHDRRAARGARGAHPALPRRAEARRSRSASS